MGKIVVAEFIALDGVIDSPENWHFPYVSDDMQAVVNADIDGAAAFLYGRVTYDVFAGFWPTDVNNETGIADKLNGTPKYVVSSTLQKADWNNTTILRTIDDVAKMRQQISGTISTTGSATLIESLIKADLVDEYRLFLHPIVVGSGKRLFREGSNTCLKLVETKQFNGGVMLLVYQPDRKA